MKDNLFESLDDINDPYVFAICNFCSWQGVPSDCETYEDSDGWEYPTYTVAICPECNEEYVMFFRKSKVIEYNLLKKENHERNKI